MADRRAGGRPSHAGVAPIWIARPAPTPAAVECSPMETWRMGSPDDKLLDSPHYGERYGATG